MTEKSQVKKFVYIFTGVQKYIAVVSELVFLHSFGKLVELFKFYLCRVVDNESKASPIRRI